MDLSYKPKFREKDKYDDIFATDPIIYYYDNKGNLVSSMHLSEYKNPKQVKRKVRLGARYFLEEVSVGPIGNGREKITKCFKDGVLIGTYKSVKEAALIVFNNEKEANNIRKHIKRNTPYKGYNFEII